MHRCFFITALKSCFDEACKNPSSDFGRVLGFRLTHEKPVVVVTRVEPVRMPWHQHVITWSAPAAARLPSTPSAPASNRGAADEIRFGSWWRGVMTTTAMSAHLLIRVVRVPITRVETAARRPLSVWDRGRRLCWNNVAYFRIFPRHVERSNPV